MVLTFHPGLFAWMFVLCLCAGKVRKSFLYFPLHHGWLNSQKAPGSVVCMREKETEQLLCFSSGLTASSVHVRSALPHVPSFPPFPLSLPPSVSLSSSWDLPLTVALAWSMRRTHRYLRFLLTPERSRMKTAMWKYGEDWKKIHHSIRKELDTASEREWKEGVYMQEQVSRSVMGLLFIHHIPGMLWLRGRLYLFASLRAWINYYPYKRVCIVYELPGILVNKSHFHKNPPFHFSFNLITSRRIEALWPTPWRLFSIFSFLSLPLSLSFLYAPIERLLLPSFQCTNRKRLFRVNHWWEREKGRETERENDCSAILPSKHS